MITLLPLLLLLAAPPARDPGSNLPRNPTERFNQLDTNNDGAITPDEAPNWFKMKGLDANNDRRITLKEGMDWLTKQQANQQTPRNPRNPRTPETPSTDSNLLKAGNIVYADTPTDARRQSLDIYGSTKDSVQPVVVYIHGGGWAKGDKAGVGKKAQWLASEGWMLVSINYRLSPAVKHPAHIEDVAEAIAWVHDNIAKHGGDPERIVVMGHSAGAHLAALVATDPKRLGKHDKSLSIIDRAILLDGAAYDIPNLLSYKNLPDSSRTMHYNWVGTREADHVDASPSLHIKEGTDIPPFLILHTDRTLGTAECKAMARKMEEAGIPAITVLCDEETHTSMNRNLGTEGHAPTEAVRLTLEGAYDGD